MLDTMKGLPLFDVAQTLRLFVSRKEVTFISLLSSAVLHFILVKYIYKKDASTETRSPSPYPLQQVIFSN